MDDSSPKPSSSGQAGTSQANIDDLVKELSRPQGAPPQAPTSSGPIPSSSVVPAPSPAGSSSAPPRPTPPPSAIPSPAPATTPSKPTAAPLPTPPKQYQSSIRTMNDDLSKLKAGQKPEGTNVPRTVPAAPTAPQKPAASAPAIPAVPRPNTPTSTLPQSIKSAPLAPKSMPAPLPSASSLPVKPQAPAASSQQSTTASFPSSSSSSRRPLILVGALILVLILGGLYWYFMIKGGGTQVVESPIPTFTPRPTATPNSDVLGTVFPNKGGNIVLPPTGDVANAFAAAINAQPNITPGSFTAVDVISNTASSGPQLLTLPGLLNRFGAQFPTGLNAVWGKNFKTLLYGQKEVFDSKGKPVANPSASSRLVIVSELAGPTESVLQEWETTMSASLAGLMGITPAKNTGPFMTTLYNGATIRFKNFPYPDHSIDYAVVSFQGQNYLVLASSREATFAAIDAFVVKGK